MNQSKETELGLGSAKESRGSSDHPALDVCVVTARPRDLTALEQFFRDIGCRPVITTPSRLPSESEWEAFDVVLLDKDPSGDFPEIPERRTCQVLAICDASELNNPDVLRAALRAGARDLLPRSPNYPAWKALLKSAQPSPPRVFLKFVDPATRMERILNLEGESLSVGRDPHNDIVFTHAFISRRHALLERAGKTYRLVDNQSRHGTFLNGERVREHVLADGDRIRLGGAQGPQLTFHLLTEPDSTMDLSELSGIFQSEGVNREVHDIALLLEAILSVNTNLLLDEILELVLDRVIEFVGAERGMILLRPFDGKSFSSPLAESLNLAVARDKFGKSIEKGEIHISQKIPEEVLRSGKGVLIEDLLDDRIVRDHRSTVEIGVRSAMCVPLKVRGGLFGDEDGPTVIGALYVDSHSRGRPFSPRALDALEVLAAEAAMAIHTARHYEESLEKRRMEEEMEIARKIQQNIFPRQDHRSAHWEVVGTTTPSLEVGGDFMTCFPLGNERFALVLGDVSGKGVPAALFSTMLHGLFYGLANFRGESPELGAAFSRLNQFLLTNSRLQRFVTSIFGFLGSEGSFHFVNAGHNPGLVVRRDGKEEELHASGTILGMFESVEYQAAETQLDSGDLLLLYSDGIPDSTNPAGEMFGLQRLKEVVRSVSSGSARDVHQTLLEAFDSFLEGNPPRDDATLLVVKRL